MAQDYDYGQLIDDFELGADVMPDETLTQYIERRRREFESKADGGSIGIEVLFMDKEPRTKMVSGGFLKAIGAGLGSLFKGGKDKIDDIIETKAMEKIGFRSRDDIPLSTYSEMKGPIKLSDMENIPEDQLKKILRTQELGLYEETPELLKAANLLQRFTKKVGGKRVIDYERAEAILGVKLKGNETLDDLFKIEFETRPEMKANGGRVGLFMGGPALTGTALDIYNSMKAYGFADEDIANALRARGLYDTTPTPTAPVQPLQPNITRPNGGGKDENDGPGVKDPYAGLGFSSANFGLGTQTIGDFVNKDAVMDYEADAAKIGRTPLGQLSRVGIGIIESLKNVPTPVNLIRKGIEFTKQRAAEKKAQEEAIARDAFREAMRQGPSFYDSLRGGRGASVSRSSREEAGSGFGDVSESGPFKDGGLATMFTRRR